MRRRKNTIDLGLDLREAIKRVSASYEAVLSLDPLVEDEALMRAHLGRTATMAAEAAGLKP